MSQQDCQTIRFVEIVHRGVEDGLNAGPAEFGVSWFLTNFLDHLGLLFPL